MPIEYKNLKPGDLIICHEANLVAAGQHVVKLAKRVTMIPSIISFADSGSTFTGKANANHALIVTPAKETAGAVAYRTHYLAHMANAGACLTAAKDFFMKNTASYAEVFRLGRGVVDKTEKRCTDAGQVGHTWCSSDGEARPRETDREKAEAKKKARLRYAKGKAGGSVFHRSYYGGKARKRADFYAEHKDTKGGPQDLKDVEKGHHKSMFCSMFVIACFQAVLADRERRRCMALDAKHTSPMALDEYLKKTGCWTSLGTIS